MAARFSIVATIVVLCSIVTSPLKARGNSDSDALTALRQSLSDPDNVLESWDPNLVDPCTWIYVTCNDDSQVTRLDLGFKNLSGHLVPELGKLENLQYLELYRNNIQGEIPWELGNLKNLKSLDLYNNNLSGTIPASLENLTSLVFLRLNDNKLSGTVPEALLSIPVLDLSNNNLSGPTTGAFKRTRLSK